MLSTNQRPTQDYNLPSFRDGKTLDLAENLPREIRAGSPFWMLYANSQQEASSGVPMNWTAPPVYPKLRFGHRPQNTHISLQAHIKNARSAIGELLDRKQQAEQTKAHQEALAWLARNREKYSGQWIALRGAELLATGTNARDIYAQVRGISPSVLILKIEREDLPFGGW